jgi:hypothetical protein
MNTGAGSMRTYESIVQDAVATIWAATTPSSTA